MVLAVPSTNLRALNQSIKDLGDLILSESYNNPMGMIGQQQLAKVLNSDAQAKTPEAFKQLSILSHNQTYRLQDIADVQLQHASNSPKAWTGDQPAISLGLYRNGKENALESADKLHQWLATAQFGEGVTITPYFEVWQLIVDRINLLLKNGFWGLLFILAILFLFLQTRVAIWIAVGIPTSFMAGLGILYWTGGSINMVSLFAIICRHHC